MIRTRIRTKEVLTKRLRTPTIHTVNPFRYWCSGREDKNRGRLYITVFDSGSSLAANYGDGESGQDADVFDLEFPSILDVTGGKADLGLVENGRGQMTRSVGQSGVCRRQSPDVVDSVSGPGLVRMVER